MEKWIHTFLLTNLYIAIWSHDADTSLDWRKGFSMPKFRMYHRHWRNRGMPKTLFRQPWLLPHQFLSSWSWLYRWIKPLLPPKVHQMWWLRVNKSMERVGCLCKGYVLFCWEIHALNIEFRKFDYTSTFICHSSYFRATGHLGWMRRKLQQL